jgi:hypothetical protein
MSKKDWRIKSEILAKLNLESIYESLGIKFKGKISASGWRQCLNPYKPEKNASSGIYLGSGRSRGLLKIFNSADTESSRTSFWQFSKDFHPELGSCKPMEIIKFWAKEASVSLNDGDKKPPTSENVEFYRKNLTNEVRKYLNEIRGLNDQFIEKYEIGWSVKRERLAFPVYDKDGELVNIRFHAWKKDQKPKTLNSTGFGKKSLWGIDRLVKAPDDATVIITEGEFDAMLAEQETGLVSVSPTNGTQGFDLDWIQYFKGKHVVLVWDCDKEGRESVAKTVIPAFKTAIRNGEVKSIRAVWLFKNDDDKQQKDFTDFIVKAGGSGADILKMIESTAPEEFQLPDTSLPEAVPLKSFTEVDNPEYSGKRVAVDLYIHGENSEAYHAPTVIEVTECPGRKKLGCSGRSDWDWSCDEPIQIRQGDRIQLAGVNTDDFRLNAHLQKFVCDRGQKPVLKIDSSKNITLREVFAHQVVSGASNSTELVEKPIYTIGHELYKIGQYRATGFVHTHPRHQKPTILIDTMERQEEDWQSFRLTDEAVGLLKDVQKLDATSGELTQELMYAVTKIYGRHNLHLGVLLSLCSPRWIEFPGEGLIRGWVSTVIIGDTGTGKSDVSTELFKYANVGYRISGSTASRTGITYSIDYDERRGWRIKAGAHLKMSGQALIVDEAQDLQEADLKTMAEALDSGRLQIDRIQNKNFEAETRVIFVCNPVEPKRRRNQKPIASFPYGCMSLIDIFPKMMLRRLDLAIFAASFDIKNQDEVFNTVPPKGYKLVISEKHLRSLIFYAWNLQPEQIIISDKVAKLIRNESSRLSNIFGQCEDIPIVYPADFRKTFARLCVSLAVLDLSSTDDFQTIVVEKDHVDAMSDLLETWYRAQNCQLDQHSRVYAKEYFLSEEEQLYKKLKNSIDNNPERRMHLSFVIGELLKLKTDGQEKLSQADIRDYIDVAKVTIFRFMKPWVDMGLIKSQRGYLPTAKLFRFLHWLKEEHPDFLDLDY